MGLNIKTMACNGSCRSCYERSIREVDKDCSYDIDKMMQSLEIQVEKYKKENKGALPRSMSVHGGEPLLLKNEDLERILKRMYELKGYTGLQTNLISLRDFHLDLFQRYKTNVGVSIDGDTAELNYGRWNDAHFSMDEVQKQTDGVLDNMRRVMSANLKLSVIVVLRKYNAVGDRLFELIRSLKRFQYEFGIRSFRMNEGIVYDPALRAEEELTAEELGNCYCTLAKEVFDDPYCDWLPYRDVVDLLFGYKDSTCIFNECDVWKTGAEVTIMGDGSIGGCLKSGGALDGMQILAALEGGRERYDALLQTPQEHYGCKGCKYWYMCKGGCPGAGVDNDWRNRTRFCKGWKMLYAYTEKRLRSMMPNIRLVPEFFPYEVTSSIVLASIKDSSWRESKRQKTSTILKDFKAETEISPTGVNRPHGDVAHGDHLDKERR